MSKDKATIDEKAELIEAPIYISSITNLPVQENNGVKPSDMKPLKVKDGIKASEITPTTKTTSTVFAKAMTWGKGLARFKIHRGENMSETASIDPLTWKDINTMKWWPGILAIIISYSIAPVISVLFFNVVGWKEYAIHESRWWQCGVYCAVIWLTSLEAFGIQCIQFKVRSKSEYKDFVPSKAKLFFVCIFSDLVAFTTWTLLYIVNGYKLLLPLVQSYTISNAGIIGTAVLQNKFLVPEKISFKKDIFLLCLLGLYTTSIVLFFSLCCMLVYVYSSGFKVCLVFFLMSRAFSDMLIRWMTSYTNSNFLEYIFTTISALSHNIFLYHSLSYDWPSSYSGIIFAAFLNSGVLIYYYVFMTCPAELHMGFQNQKTALRALWSRHKPEFPVMTNEEQRDALNLRSQFVYMVILDMASKLILPWWLPLQLTLIMFHTTANTSIVTFGLDTSWESFIHRFYIALIMNALDIINMAVLTYFICLKYPLYDPFRILSLIFEKFGFLTISGLMLILISTICLLIIDCLG